MSKLESLDSTLYEPLGASESARLDGGLQCRIGFTNNGSGAYTVDDYDRDPPSN